MICKLNNRGFTLIELLAVLVILTAIMGIAIPAISSSLERSKDKQNKSRIKLLESAAELYVSDNKNDIYKNMTGNTCGINLDTLVNKNYVSSDAIKDADGNRLGGYVLFNRNNLSYEVKSGSISKECWKSE